MHLALLGSIKKKRIKTENCSGAMFLKASDVLSLYIYS